MGLQESFPINLQILRKSQKKSLVEFSQDLCISRSMLQEYLNGEGNPTLRTVDVIADKLGISPTVLVSDVFIPTQLEVIMFLLETLDKFTRLTDKQKLYFAEKFLELIEIWTQDSQA